MKTAHPPATTTALPPALTRRVRTQSEKALTIFYTPVCMGALGRESIKQTLCLVSGQHFVSKNKLRQHTNCLRAKNKHILHFQSKKPSGSLAGLLLFSTPTESTLLFEQVVRENHATVVVVTEGRLVDDALVSNAESCA